MLKGLQGLRAYKLASVHGHLWPNAITEIAGERVSENATAKEFEAAIAAVIEEGVSVEEIQKRAAIINETQVVLGIEAPEFDEEYNSIFHTTGSGRLTWEIATDGTVTFTVSRPFGNIIRAWVHEDGSFDAEYLAADGGKNVRYRHILALEEAVQVLVPDADVKALFPEVPSAAEDELAADVLEQVLKSNALADRKHIVQSPVHITVELSADGWRIVDAKTLVEQA